MSDLNLSNIVNVSVNQAPAGLSDFQVNNLLILTKEVPLIAPANGFFSTYRSPADVATDWGTASEAYQMAVLIFSQTPNILSGDGELIIAPQGAGVTLADAITAMLPKIFFGGVLSAGYSANDAEFQAAGVVCQAARKLLAVPSYLAASGQAGGLFVLITAARLTYSRCLLYTLSDQLHARLEAAAYFGRAMSTNFSGSATCQTMHGKDLAGVLPDPGITQTILDNAEAVGFDVYANVSGLPKVFSTGANQFWDQVYNLTWFVFALQVAGANVIFETSTKIPQTEPGIAVLRGAYIDVLKQAVVNGYLAPGQWNSPELFGDPDSLKRNILQTGFYIYSQPVNAQPQTDRAARKAPLIQIAAKEAGAVQSSDVVVNVNA